MPRIPLYAEGRIGQVGLATGQLSPRADVSAFAAPGRATAEFASSLGDMAFRLGMAEREREDDRINSQIVREVSAELDDWNLQNQDTNIEDATTSANQKFSEITERIRGGNYGTRRTKLIESNLGKVFASQLSAAKQNAFNRGQEQYRVESNQFVASRLEEIRKFGLDSPQGQLALSQANDQISMANVRGIKTDLDSATFLRQAKLDDYGALTQAATNVGQTESLIETINADEKLNRSQKASLISALQSKQVEIESDFLLGVGEQIIDAELSPEEIDAALKQADDGNIQITRADGSVFSINFDGVSEGARIRASGQLRAQKAGANLRDTNAVLSLVNSYVIGQEDPSVLEKAAQDTMVGKGPFGTDDASLNRQLSGIIQSAADAQKNKLIFAAQGTQAGIVEALKLSDGQLTPEIQKGVANVSGQYRLAGREDLATAFEENITVASQAAQAFSTIKLSSEADERALAKQILDEGKAAAAAGDFNRVKVLSGVQKNFQEMLSKKREAVAQDPVGYIEATMKRKLEPSERIAMQTQLGIPAGNLRVATDAEMTAFKTNLEAATSYQEKANIGLGFVQQFGEQNETIVMRNLAERGIISLPIQMMMASPTNVANFDIDAAHAETTLSQVKKVLGADQTKEVYEAVRVRMGDYSNSVLGSPGAETASRAATAGRFAHALAMTDMTSNVAAYYKMIDPTMSIDEAADKAYQNTVGQLYSFVNIDGGKGGVVRLTKAYDGLSNIIGQALQASLQDVDYLLQTVKTPSKEGIESPITDAEYVSDLRNEGKWVTTTDNKGVYLVDKTGNMVLRKTRISPPGAAERFEDRFIYVRFDSIAGYVEPFAEINEKERNLTENLRDRDAYIRTQRLF